MRLYFCFVLCLFAFAYAQNGVAFEYEQALCDGVECNSGTCQVVHGRAVCVCPDAFVGAACEKPSCNFRGRFLDESCVCLPGYSAADDCASCTKPSLEHTTFCIEHNKYFRRVDVDATKKLRILREGTLLVNGKTRRAFLPEKLDLDCACRSQLQSRYSEAAGENVLSDLLDESVSVLYTTDAQLYSMENTVSQEQGEQRTLWVISPIFTGFLITLCGAVVAFTYRWEKTLEEDRKRQHIVDKSL